MTPRSPRANQPHEIHIQITPEGKIIGEVKGVYGPHCAPLSEWLDELGTVETDRQTADYRKPDEQILTIKR